MILLILAILLSPQILIGGLAEISTTNSGLYRVPNDLQAIQTAIDSAADGDTVLVSPGTYKENISYKGKNIVLGSLFLTTGDASYISKTIIDGDSSSPVVTFNNNEDSSAVLSGFTVKNGFAENGAGIAITGSNPTLDNLLITNNTALNQGGGIYVDQGNPVMQNLIVEYNFVTEVAAIGAGIFLYETSCSVNNCIVRHNTAEWDNSSAGGIAIYGHSDVIVKNALIHDNEAAFGGGIWCSASSHPRLINTTLANNAAGNGGGIFMSNNSTMELVNSILWNNGEHEVLLRTGNEKDLRISYSTIMGGREKLYNWGINQIDFDEGEGFISEDPQFADIDNDDYTPLPLSPCINAGTPDISGLGLPPVDLSENNRIYGGRIDMGAYEFQGDPAQNIPPTPAFTIVPGTGTITTSFHFDASSSTDNRDSPSALQVRWDWESDGAWDTEFSTDKTAEYTFAEAGMYTVTLEVRDTDRLTATVQKIVTVANEFNREVSYTVPGAGATVTAPFMGASLSLRFLTGNAAGGTLSVAGFGSSLPDSLHAGERFEKAVGYYSLSSEEITSFTGTLTFSYDDSMVAALEIPEDSLSISYWDDNQARWRAVVTTVDSDSNTAAATINHFSLWALTDRSDDLISTVEYGQNGSGAINTFTLHQNYPNPFNPTTTIRYELPRATAVALTIYNILGQKICTLAQEAYTAAGVHAVIWNGRDDAGVQVASGVYLYEMRAGEFVDRKKLLILR